MPPAFDIDGQSETSTESEREAVRIFAERCRAVGPSLATFRETFRLPPLPDEMTHQLEARWWTTGIGASEGPARICAATLRAHAGINAEFRPFSAFFGPPDGAEAAQLPDVVVIFSQGLSPNARMVVTQAVRTRGCHTVLFTSAATAGAKACAASERALSSVTASGGRTIRLPLPEERGLMVRLVGPAVAGVAALGFVDQLAALRHRKATEGSTEGDRGGSSLLPSVDELERCYSGAPSMVDEAMAGLSDQVLLDDIAFLTESNGLEPAKSFANKWLEARMTREPPVWDVMSFAHGPLQAYWDRALTVVSLERCRDGRAGLLFDRVAEVIQSDRHHHIRIKSDAAGWGNFFVHDAAVNELCRRALVRDPCDTRGWPGSGVDAALYDIDGYVEPTRS